MHTDSSEEETESIEVKPGLCVNAYPSEDAARQAASEYGGVVLEVGAADLRAINEFDADFHLSRDDEEGLSPTVAFVTVIFGSLPHEWSAQKSLASFNESPTARAWFESLETAFGEDAGLTQ
jgi:hypothetical protein